MKFLIFFLFIPSVRAQIAAPSSCPYLVRDQASLDVLKSTRADLSEELNRVSQEMAEEKANCLLPAISEVATSENLIRTLANQMVPPPHSFQSLMLAGNNLNCTTTVGGFNEVLVSYKEFVVDNFNKLPARAGDLENYLDMKGSDGEKINEVFRNCHSELSGKTTSIREFDQCIDRDLFGPNPNSKSAMSYQIWNTNCGQNLEESSEAIQKLLNSSEQKLLKQRTTEELIRASYNQINDTIDSLLKVDPACRAAPQVANIANSLVAATVGLGQMMGTPWTGLALNLMAKPVSQMINRIAQSDKRQQEKELKEMYDKINNLDKQRNEKFLCSMLSMQKLKCDTFRQYKPGDCHPPGDPLNDNLNVKGIVDILTVIKGREGKQDPLINANITDMNALDYMQDQTIEQLSELHKQFNVPVKGLTLMDGKSKDLSLKEYLFGPGGVMDQLDPKSISSVNDKIKFQKEKILMDQLKASFEDFDQSMNSIIEGNLNPQSASLALNSYKSITALLVNSNTGAIQTRPSQMSGIGMSNNMGQQQMNSSQVQGQGQGQNQYQGQYQGQQTQSQQNSAYGQQSYSGNTSQGGLNQPSGSYNEESMVQPSVSGSTPVAGNVNISFILSTYFDQMSKQDKNSETYKYALREMKAHAESKVEQARESAVKGLAVSNRFENTEHYFNFMSGNYAQETILQPIVDKIELPTNNVAKGPGREVFFDAKVLPAIRDCLFLYQPMMKHKNSSKSSKKMVDDYKSRCDFIFKCKNKLGFDLDLNNTEDLNSTADMESYQAVCHVQKNFGFIFSKAKINFVNDGDACGK